MSSEDSWDCGLHEWRDGGVVVSDAGGLQFDAFVNAPSVSRYSAKEVSFMLIVWRSLRGEVFNYSFLLLPGQLDGAACFNNCPGYSRVTVYSFCVVLRRARSYPSGYSLVWSSTPEWLMLQTSNQGFWCPYTVHIPNLNSSEYFE